MAARAEVADSASDDAHSDTPIGTQNAPDLADAADLASTAIAAAETSALTLSGTAASDAEEGFVGTHRHFPRTQHIRDPFTRFGPLPIVGM